MKKILLALAFCLFACASFVSAQPRTVNKSDSAPAAKTLANSSIEAKYEGGMFGYTEKENGTLKFDDANERLVFFGKDGKEHFGISYSSLLVVSPNSQKVQSGTGRAVSAVPIIGAGIGGGFIKKKKNYLIIQFRDADVDVQGTVNFLLDTDELLASVIQTIGAKAKLTPRGDAFYRPRAAQKTEL